ncbi:hypothetical protein [Bradyrhizobium liaoningense]|uniref:hypothetical protein n=1 Tax=Bradyrhizobium liaoningense TaxID=43992 RepID=UPI001BABC996|nr:hypothetical protein [Bradyrhizobium liaoningense]MBR1033244.1 hypothetical protein [Bradyrhizobium liaoningense]
MHRYIARANVDHYLGILCGTNLTPQHRSTAMALLIAELDKLSDDAEHLGFAESKVASSRDQVTQAASIRDSFAAGTSEREHAERHLVHLERAGPANSDSSLSGFSA